MEVLEAYDLTGGLRAAAALAGCDHKTVAHHVALRDAGADERAQRPMLIDELLATVEEWVDRSRGRIARTWCTTSWSRGDPPARSGPPAAPSRR